MAKARKLKVAAANYPVPQSATEADEYILRIGVAQRNRVRLEADLNDRIAALKEEYEKQAQPLKETIEDLTRGLQTYCEAHRDELTSDGKVKFHRFGAGEVNWRKKPAKVTLRKVDDVIERLKALNLDRFLRVKEEVNKEAMLGEAEVAKAVDGVSIGSEGEDFVITPLETKLEQVA